MMIEKKQQYVWDPLIRIFHWSLVIFFFIAYFSGEEENLLHVYSGYVVFGLIIFRIIWGFIGTKHARFSDFVYRPGEVYKYCKELACNKPHYYEGHNPAGGYMVILMLFMLAVISISGLKVYGLEGHGPLAGAGNGMQLVTAVYADEDEGEEGEEEEDEYEESEHHGGKNHMLSGMHQQRVEENEAAEEFWEEIHEAATNITLLLIALHILGVVVSSGLHKENLVKAMITGEKEVIV